MQLLVFVLFALKQFSIPEALVLPNLYPFGPSEGDIALPHLGDGSSGEIPILVPFLFFGQSYDSLFVSEISILVSPLDNFE